ncbi:hypothetical protein [Hyphomicrobium sp.]|uniref:hypothetical protein n=1 Tax=Hyphomicrobium sp. TaxID=82 RepID=UPI002E323247|nr:hypothetical protein [Hyphomicrobium sp.]HEX2841181.1 hypothetical protein [Hyphomicrobium sp.]
MARWRKLGRIYEPRAIHPKLVSHAANPLAVPLGGDLYRIYFSSRDEEKRSSVGFVDFDMAKREIVRECKEPVIEHGPRGSYYEHGISVGCWYEVDGQRYILFMGWQNPPGGHWRGDIGRLCIEPDGSLTPDGATPLLGSNEIDPISLSYPWVERRPEGGYRMWYGSTVSWDAGNGEMLHVINHAVSQDGHHWHREGLAVPFALGEVQAFSRPTVVGDAASGYRMWFSYRGAPGRTYRIGCAASRDGEAWSLRMTESGIDVSAEGWDSEMIEYPFVFRHGGQVFMLYNGNGFGQTGFGLAVLED